MESKALCWSVFIYCLFTYCFGDLQSDRQDIGLNILKDIGLESGCGIVLPHSYCIAECLLGDHCNISMSAKTLGDTVRVTN